MTKPDRPGWYRDGASVNRVRWWTGRNWHDLTRSDRNAKKLPEQTVAGEARAPGTPPGLYTQNGADEVERHWWSGTDWCSSLTEILHGLVGDIVMCARIVEVAAVHDDFVALVTPWEREDFRPMLLPLQQIACVLPYQSIVNLAPYSATVNATLVPAYLAAGMNSVVPAGRAGSSFGVGVGVAVPIGGGGGSDGGSSLVDFGSW